MVKEFKPYIASEQRVAEFSLKAILLGLFLGVLFALGNAYLALKIGTTVSASIPAAIVSMALFRISFRKSTVLENNIVQTIATIGEGLAGGVVFTIPALFLLGELPSITNIFLLSCLGGVLGILFMIPMRRYIIVQEHGVLPFPEGTACAEIIKSGQKSKDSALLALWGMIVGVVYKIGSSILFIWEEIYKISFSWLQGTLFFLDATPALLGVGYLIGPRITSLMFAGGAIAWWVLIPLIKLFGAGQVIIYPSHLPIAELGAEGIWNYYIRYIGAGCVATGGLIGLIKIGPVLYKTFHHGFKELFLKFHVPRRLPRTDKDISLAWLILGSIAILFFLWLYPGFSLNLFTIFLLIVLGFFFAAVTSLTVGLVGSTSNPVSGMSITILLVTCLFFVFLNWTERVYLIAAMTMSCIANIIICLASTTSQDLKTGFLLGATPRSQQLAGILGVILPSLALGGALYIFNEAYHIGSSKMPAPQASLMAMIVEGVIQGSLPYTLVIIGVILALLLYMLHLPILPFALGLYLPLSLSSATMIGGLVAGCTSRLLRSEQAKEKGTLLASGLIGGDACTGILIAVLSVAGVIPTEKQALLPPFFTLIAFLLVAYFLGHFAVRKTRRSS